MISRFNRRVFLGSAAGISILASYPFSSTSAADRRAIATSMPILQDIVSNIVGDLADVFSILPANADPHTWEATPEDMVRASEADAFIYIGADLEPFVESGGWQGTVRDSGIPELAVSEHVTRIEVEEDHDHEEDGHDHHGSDPHIWLDPLTIVEAVPAIAALLGDVDAANANSYQANADAYTKLLNDLHAELEESFTAIPDDNRKLLVFHDAWQYFAARYNFEIIGIVLENPDGEASARDIADLLNVVEESGINVVFAEPQFNTSVLDLLESEGDVEIATLLTDSFTEDVDTYFDLMRFNRDQIVSHLAN